jgi:hypothetical protein
MKESVLQDFLAGRVAAQALAVEAAGAFERHTDGAGTLHSRLRTVAAPTEFELRTEHLLRLLDAVEA